MTGSDKNQSQPLASFDPLDLLKSLHEIINKRTNLKETLDSTLSLMKSAMGISAGAVYIADETGRWSCRAATTQHSLDGPDENRLIRKIAQTRQTLTIPDLEKDEIAAEDLHSWLSGNHAAAGFIGIPILDNEEVSGILAVLLPSTTEQDLNAVAGWVTIIASVLVQPIRNRHIVDLERQKLLEENVVLKQKLQEEFSFHNLIGNSHEMRDVYEQVAQVARTNTTVLLRGESGTGKELIAEAVHYNSLRNDKPFIRVNCAAVPETLIESEFFGYEKGAFTGAVGRKAGRFELAHEGTIFLDEIGELSPMTQVKLLRMLQDQSFERVGGTETIRINVRVIAATNSDLEASMKEGKFRDDLYYRLNIFSIYMPPLRDRKTDIILLADHFLQKYSRQHARAVKRISTPAIDMLMRYHWPGNVRELENCIERAVIVCEDQVLHAYHLPPSLQTAESSGTLPTLSLKDAVSTYEKELIQDALKSTRGNRSRAARLLGTTERIIGYKIKNLDIDISRFKP